MQWLRRGPGKQVQPDLDWQRAVLHDVRQRFGGHVQVRFADQAQAVSQLLTGDGGLFLAVGIVREFADTAHADLLGQVGDLYRRTGHGLAVDRRNYRPLGQAAGPRLRWALGIAPGGLHPYVHVAAAVMVVGAGAQRIVRLTDPYPLLASLFEVLDLTIAGWEFGRIRVDTDAATLAGALITAARDLRDAMSDPPPLPPPVRELMRRNNSLEVHDPAANRVVGTFNPGKRMRELLLA
jgi:hypothetical protein